MKFDITKIDLSNIKTIKWIALAFLLIVLFLDVIFLSPLISSLQQTKVQKDKDIAALGFFKDLIAKKDKLTTVRIIPQESVDSFLDEVQKIADKDKVDVKIGISLIADKNDDDKDFYARKDFIIKASGSFKDLGIFLTALRQMPDAVLDIEGIRVVSDSIDAANVQAQIKFMLLTTKDD